MKDVVKTGVSVLVVFLILVVIFLIVGNTKYSIEMLNTVNLDLKDPTTKILYDRVKNNVNFRKADMKVSELTSDEVIPYIIFNLDKSDYTNKEVEPVKIVCEVTSNIKFTSNKKCNIKIVDNDTIKQYEKKLFNLDTELDFGEFKKGGLHCKNTGTKYYCLTGTYTEEKIGYSSFVSATEYKGKMTITEYYLQINLTDNKRCAKYFDEKYCSNYYEMDKPSLSKETIEKDGVLYQHVFYKVDNSYYLENSFIVTER